MKQLLALLLLSTSASAAEINLFGYLDENGLASFPLGPVDFVFEDPAPSGTIDGERASRYYFDGVVTALYFISDGGNPVFEGTLSDLSVTVWADSIGTRYSGQIAGIISASLAQSIGWEEGPRQVSGTFRTRGAQGGLRDWGVGLNNLGPAPQDDTVANPEPSTMLTAAAVLAIIAIAARQRASC